MTSNTINVFINLIYIVNWSKLFSNCIIETNAFYTGNERIVDYLIKNGADVNLEDNDEKTEEHAGKTALQKATEHSNLQN